MTFVITRPWIHLRKSNIPDLHSDPSFTFAKDLLVDLCKPLLCDCGEPTTLVKRGNIQRLLRMEKLWSRGLGKLLEVSNSSDSGGGRSGGGSGSGGGGGSDTSGHSGSGGSSGSGSGSNSGGSSSSRSRSNSSSRSRSRSRSRSSGGGGGGGSGGNGSSGSGSGRSSSRLNGGSSSGDNSSWSRSRDYDYGEDSYGYEEKRDYGGYEYSHNQELDENEGYYSEGECEINDNPSSYSEFVDDEELCNGSYKENRACEEYYTFHSEPRGDVRYNPFIYKSYEDPGENVREDYEVSYSSSCSTSYQGQIDENGYANYSRGCSMEIQKHASPKTKGTTSFSSYPSDQTYGNGNQGRYGGYSRSQDLPTLSIFLRDSGLEEYLYKYFP
ncbi:secreted protein C-like [Capsicum annuum]|uniref:secreted protein C-like n=1 Tax=Capsicum annuum TaxID=4072 RepID=UPI001FB08D72|nr:secreted protein C-like [Capsicum annuum]